MYVHKNELLTINNCFLNVKPDLSAVMNDTMCILLLYQHIHLAILVFLHRNHPVSQFGGVK